MKHALLRMADSSRLNSASSPFRHPVLYKAESNSSPASDTSYTPYALSTSIRWQHNPQFGSTYIAVHGVGQQASTATRKKKCHACCVPRGRTAQRITRPPFCNAWNRVKYGLDERGSRCFVILLSINWISFSRGTSQAFTLFLICHADLKLSTLNKILLPSASILTNRPINVPSSRPVRASLGA